jgi:hypothetical protein
MTFLSSVGERFMASSQQRGLPVRYLTFTEHRRLSITAIPGQTPGKEEFAVFQQEARSPGSTDELDWHAISAPLRLRSDRLERFVDLLDAVVAEAEARGIWLRRGDA